MGGAEKSPIGGFYPLKSGIEIGRKFSLTFGLKSLLFGLLPLLAFPLRPPLSLPFFSLFPFPYTLSIFLNACRLPVKIKMGEVLIYTLNNPPPFFNEGKLRTLGTGTKAHGTPKLCAIEKFSSKNAKSGKLLEFCYLRLSQRNNAVVQFLAIFSGLFWLK